MRLNIDFSPLQWRVSVRSLLMLAGALIAFGAAAWNTFTAFDETQRVNRRLAHPSWDRVLEQVTLSPAQIDAINRVIRQLNLPWEHLFAEVEARLGGHIALLALEPDASDHMLRLQGEARSVNDMLDFVDVLGQSTFLNDVVLIRHEINEADRNRSLRFVVEARWRTD